MKKILVIEDEPEMRRNLATVLRLENYQPVTAENGRAGVAAAKQEKPDLILCDVMMPEMSGIELYEQLEGKFPAYRQRIVFMTGGAFTSQARDALEHFGAPRLEKPFSEVALRRVIAIVSPPTDVVATV